MRPIDLKTPNGASAKIYPYGAHVSSWKTARGKEWIFMSSQALFEEGKAIRGGVPIIFPQFNEFGLGQRHGFARTSFWDMEKTSAQQEEHDRENEREPLEERSHCTFLLKSSEKTYLIWPHQFEARFTVTLTDNSLTMSLAIKNTGTTDFSFTAALHSYFTISQLNQIKIEGLNGTHYWDNDGSEFNRRKTSTSHSLTINDALDRVYFAVNKPLLLIDGKEKLSIAQHNFPDTVIWNPGEKAAAALKDFTDDEYQHMICIEAAAIDAPIILSPGKEWIGEQLLRDESI